MPERAARNSALRSSPSSSEPSTSFVFIRTLVLYGDTIGAASRCDGFRIASSSTSASMNFVWWISLITRRGPVTGRSNVVQVADGRIKAQPFAAADGPPASCQVNRRRGPPQNNSHGRLPPPEAALRNRATCATPATGSWCRQALIFFAHTWTRNLAARVRSAVCRGRQVVRR